MYTYLYVCLSFSLGLTSILDTVYRFDHIIEGSFVSCRRQLIRSSADNITNRARGKVVLIVEWIGNMLLLLFFFSNPSRQHTVTISLGGHEKRKDRIYGKVGVKETGGSHPGWNHLTKGIDHLTWRRTQVDGIVKGWEDK